MHAGTSIQPVASYSLLELINLSASDTLEAIADMQVASWAIFLVFLSVAIYRAHFPPRDAQHLRGAEYKPMRLFLYIILAVTLLILLRACYRVAETAMGESPLRTPCGPAGPF